MNDGSAGRGDGCLDCREVFRQMGDYVDRALSDEEIQAIEAHLDLCGPCAKELGFTEAMIRELKERLRRIRAPERLRARIASIFAPDV